MNKTLLKNLDDYRAFAFKHVSAVYDPASIDIWEGYDTEKLNKFFDLCDAISRGAKTFIPQEIREYYAEVSQDPIHLERVELRDGMEYATTDYIEEAFGVKPREWVSNYDDDGNMLEDDEEELNPKTMEFEDWVYEIKFPAVAVYMFSGGFDRFGDTFFGILDFVELKDFVE